MGQRVKLKLPIQIIDIIFPGAYKLEYLPRKKKKMLKKKVVEQINLIVNDDLLQLEIMSKLSEYDKG